MSLRVNLEHHDIATIFARPTQDLSERSSTGVRRRSMIRDAPASHVSTNFARGSHFEVWRAHMGRHAKSEVRVRYSTVKHRQACRLKVIIRG